jgi:hypothetical protein
MSLRKWFVRSLVLLVTAGFSVAGILYQRWTNPAAVRAQVIAKLGEHFVGASISLESAELRLLGGISLTGLRLARRDDSTKQDVAYVPSGVIYHDKEQLLDGKLAIRKIELYRPRLHVRRGRDGRWNVQNLLGIPHPEEPIPTIVFQQAAVIFEDQLAAPGMPPIEVSDVSITLINDPLPTLKFLATGNSELAGNLRVEGAWQRTSDETTVSIKSAGITVGPPLMKRVTAYTPEVESAISQLTGTLGLHVQLGYHPDARQPWTHSARLHLTHGSFSHPDCPVPLQNLEFTCRFLDGQAALDQLSARAGQARIELRGTARGFHLDADCEGTLVVNHLPLSREVFERLPANLRKIQDDYSPSGPVSLTVRFARTAGRLAKHCIVQPEDLTASFVRFPYPLEHLTGTLDQEIDPERHIDNLHVDLTGFAGSRPIWIRGDVTGEGPTAAVDVRIWGENIPLDQTLHQALSSEHQRLADSFHPTGLASFQAFVHREQGSHKFANRYVIRFHHATARYDLFPYPLEDVSGSLDIQPDRWDFSDFRGVHKGGQVRTRGGSCRTPEGELLSVEIEGDKILLDSELETALDPELKRAWQTFSPKGRMRFQAVVKRRPPEPPDIKVTVTAVGCSVTPTFFPYTLNDLSGTWHYENRWLTMEHVAARHAGTMLSADWGRVYLKPDGGVWAEMSHVKGAPLVPDADLIRALPPILRKTLETLEMRDPVGIRADLKVDSPAGAGNDPIVFWDGELNFAGASLRAGVPFHNVRGKAACRGRYNGHELEGVVGNILLQEAAVFNQPLQDIQAELEVKKETPGILAIRGLHARVFGGEVYGPVRIEFGPTVRYELNLTASQIRLEDFGRHNVGADAHLSGLATARLHLTGQGTEVSDLNGQGTIDVPNGRLYKLPLLLDLLKFPGLRLPDGTAFEEAHAVFAIKGMRVVVSRLDLFGNSISLRGQGEMNLDGTDVNMDFYGVWARVIQYLPPVIKEIPQKFSQQMLKIKMRGSIHDVRFSTEPVPILIDPLRDFLGRVAGRRPNGDGQPR